MYLHNYKVYESRYSKKLIGISNAISKVGIKNIGLIKLFARAMYAMIMTI